MTIAETLSVASTTPDLSIVIIDDHPLAARGVCAAFAEAGVEATSAAPAQTTAGQVANTNHSPGSSVDTTFLATDANIALVDLSMGPEPDAGCDYARRLSAKGVSVLMLTGVEDQRRLDACIAAGAEAVLSKALPLDEIVSKVLQHWAGEPLLSVAERAEIVNRHSSDARDRRDLEQRLDSLTVREREVLCQLVEGHNVSTIAVENFVAECTVRTQVKSLLRKLQVSSQLEAVALAHRVGS